MRKALALLLLLAPVLALNVTVECNGPCLTYIPAGGNAVLNYSVNGLLLDDVFTEAFMINVSGDSKDNALVKLNLTQYSCEIPGAAFLDTTPNASLETAFFDEFLLAKVNTSGTNTTLKVFCSGFNTERAQASWYGVESPTNFSSENMTYNQATAILGGLISLNSANITLDTNHDVEFGRGNITIANNETWLLNITLYDKDTLTLKASYSLAPANSFYLDSGNLTQSNKFFYVVSRGNITILDEDLTVNDTVLFNESGGIAISKVGSENYNKIVACTNNSLLTVVDQDSSGWNYTQTNMSCSFDQIHYLRYNESSGRGQYGALVGFNSTHIFLIWFNSTGWPFQISSGMSGIVDIAPSDLTGDNFDEIIVAFSNGNIRAYSIQRQYEITIRTDLLKDLGNWSSNNLKIDAHDDLVIEDGTTYTYSTQKLLRTDGSLSYWFPESIPVKMTLNMSTLITLGNITINISSGSWYYNQTWSSNQDIDLTFYPEVNNSMWVNFTFAGNTSVDDIQLTINNITIQFSNSTYVNYITYTTYTPNSLPISTSILVPSGNKIVSAEFDDMFTLDGFVVYLTGGNHSIQLDFPQYAVSMGKPSIGTSASVMNFNYTSVTRAIQGSQNEGNFSAVVGFDNAIHLVGQNVNLTTYGTLVDYCSQGSYLLYIWNSTGLPKPKATLLRWAGSLTEVANVTGNFSECWLNGTAVFLVNSSGGVIIYNYALNIYENDSFLNLSFVVRDVVMSDNLYLWNGTHKAFATPKYFTANSSFVLAGEWTTRMFEARQVYHSSNFTEIVDSPTGDVDGDSLWEKFKSAVFSLVGNVAGVLNLPQGSYSSFGNEVSVALDNGTIRTYGLSLSTPRMGWFTGFWTNVTSGSGWIALNSSETFRIDFNVTGFIYNGTDTLNSFGFKCQNATYSKYMTVTKFSNRSFRIANTTADGKYYCSIYPQWDTALPLTFPTRDLTMYVDSQWPSINDATGPVAISSTVAFNVTVNVTEDSEINLFRVYTNHSSFFPAVSGFTLDETGAYQIYTVTMTVTDVVGIPPALIRLNITAQDYTGKISGNYTVGNMTVYNANPPDTEIINTAPGNNIQDFATVPLNLSIRSLSTDDAKLSWMNATLWQDTLLQAYGEATGINYPNQTLWLNASLSGYNQTYVVQITSVDITGNKRESSIGILRHGSQTITVSGKWFSSITGTLKVYWDNDFTSGTGLRNSQQITDTQTGTNQTDATTYSVKLKTPNVDVDEWYVQANASSTSLKYVRLRYLTAQPSNAVQYVYATSYIYGLNTTDDPDSIIVRGERSMGSSEKMCLKICDEYDVGSGDCDSSWVEEKCASAGVDEYNFVVSGSNDLLDNIGTGTGFWVDKVTITSDTVVDDTGTQTTTGLIGTAVVTITAPTSKSVDVDDCADVTFTIKNTGSASASISSITASGFSTSEMTYTMLSDIDFPYGLGVNQQLQAILSFCPLKADVFNPSVCAKVGSSSKCITVKITGLGEEGEEEEEAELNLTVSVETFNDEYIVLVNTSSGPVEGVTVTITYSDGTIENYTTNVFGKINFVPKLAEFTVKVLHGGETVEKTIQELTEPIGLTLWRILVDLLIIAVLIGFGVLLDEKML